MHQAFKILFTGGLNEVRRAAATCAAENGGRTFVVRVSPKGVTRRKYGYFHVEHDLFYGLGEYNRNRGRKAISVEDDGTQPYLGDYHE